MRFLSFLRYYRQLRASWRRSLNGRIFAHNFTSFNQRGSWVRHVTQQQRLRNKI